MNAQNLGVSPWDVFHLGISKYFPYLGLGTIGIIVGLLILIPTSFMGIKPRIGTFLNIYIFGLMLDELMSSHLLEIPTSYILSLVYLIIGILTTGIGTAVYLHTDAGAGPRDALMLGLNQKTHLSIAQVRSGIEIMVVILGYILGGPIGVGTLIFSLTIGISVQWGMKWVNQLKFIISNRPVEVSK
ncbi:hypothetical protein DESME_11150 [Desulfitobacterium metallireducens DSM 15288]|uniref:YitT family protein n=1 Tax=Desulfitobacterium metallireducens DSM 15288 TaxID=871968 RepID=W0EEI9_9FIRM|nr:hypothetical protein DESME_11150 [Desulfitobacterium metallireducens DSM 15288]